ncbi:helix-turn-helix domain-containing protein [Streptomyces sp. TRM 70351]|uniref:helix-turn-helix domain-containing protein n=1 Tax=Streptomyces sp. TRM 70351 TaxID=3116552 RepID=UPI002E7B36B0|nr:helix-turn-helix domain-containing protein [Streptomyces sp. TRM 70351]MEE1927496.1 helix-turn-helix domain-containing protein [Streptomyces sp. TRM 70351]
MTADRDGQAGGGRDARGGTGGDGADRGGPPAPSDLAGELRRLRARSGLTLAALAQRTSYSKSSWERYLNGKALPPEQALRAFGRAVGVDPARLLVLRSLLGDTRPQTPAADGAPGGPPAGAPAPAPAADAPQRRWSAAAGRAGRLPRVPHVRGTGLLPLLLAVAGLVVGLAAGFGLAQGRDGADGADEAAVGSAASATGDGTPHAPGCVGFECRGKDPTRLGCHIGVWTAAVREIGDVYLELRYSPQCRAAWARITEAAVGDTARVAGPGGVSHERSISYDRDTYSPMVEAPYPASARACATLGEAAEVCTAPGGASPLSEAPTDENRYRPGAHQAASVSAGVAAAGQPIAGRGTGTAARHQEKPRTLWRYAAAHTPPGPGSSRRAPRTSLT